MTGTTGTGFVVRLVRRPLAVLALLWLVVVAVAAVFPGALTGRDPLGQDLAQSLRGPSAVHPLGTDRLGHDLLSRVVYGAASTMWGVLVAVVVSVLVGVGLGLLAGTLGRFVDAIVMRVSDLLLSVPAVIILLVVVAVFPNDVTVAMATFGVLMAAGIVRVVRSATRSLREELFVAAARVSGLSHRQIMVRHILPRLAGLVIVQASLIASIALVTQASLAFLGFGPPPPQPSWGGMINEARAVMGRSMWPLVPPGLAVALTVLAFTLLGDAIRDTNAQSWSVGGVAGRRARVPRPTRGVHQTERVRPARRARPAHSPAGGHPDAPTLLAVRDLSVAIPLAPGQRPPMVSVVSDVSFDIAPGEFVGLAGESGCGKTVTALSILGLVPGGGMVTGGSCRFAAFDLTHASAWDWRAVRGRAIGYVAQEPMASLDPTVRAGALLAEAVRRHTGATRAGARSRAVDLLGQVGLPDPARVARLYPHQLSGGMAQRVAIAFALAGSPRLLIADEPTTALDVTVQAEILTLLRELGRSRGMAVLLVTHDLGVVAELCHRVVVMYAGQVVEAGPVASVFAGPRHPYTAALLASDPHRVEPGQRLTAIPGGVPAPGRWPTGCRFADRCGFAVPACRQRPVELAATGTAHTARCLRVDQLAPRVRT